MKYFYLAGHMHPDVPETFSWRDGVIAYAWKQGWTDHDVGFYEPMPGPIDKAFKQDLALIDKSDGIIANLATFTSNRPLVGTLYELGYAYAKEKETVLWLPKGDPSTDYFKDHPFISHYPIYHDFEGVMKWLMRSLDSTIRVHSETPK